MLSSIKHISTARVVTIFDEQPLNHRSPESSRAWLLELPSSPRLDSPQVSFYRELKDRF